MCSASPHHSSRIGRRSYTALVCALVLGWAQMASAYTESWQWEDANAASIGGGYSVHVWTVGGAFDQVFDLPLQTPDTNNRYHYSVSVPDTVPSGTVVNISMQRYDATGLTSFSSNVLTRTLSAPVPPPTNSAPNATIDSPSGPVSIFEGQSVTFYSTTSDPDGDPVSVVWDFDEVGSGVANSSAADPGAVVFDRAGLFTVTLVARDDQGNVDPTPASVDVEVVALTGVPGGTPAAPEAGVSQAGDGHSDGVLVTAPDGDPRLFVVERGGVVRIFEGGMRRTAPFLDLTHDISLDVDGGLLGLAFDPDYATNGYFFTYRTNVAGDSVVSRFQVSTNAYYADSATETQILVVPQPVAGHSGGGLAFGPDGFLFVGLGDGGYLYDPAEVSQDGQSLLGKVLRLDVGTPKAPSSIATGGAYAIPADNPFVGDGSTLDEIWAIGLRNPYRISFDRVTGDLWIADQGRAEKQEINFEPSTDPGGRNYGWDVMEGTACSAVDPAPAPACNSAALTDPIFEYTSSISQCAVLGGHMYQGAITDLQGEYFFADACSGSVWSLEPISGRVTNRTAAFSTYVPGGIVATGLGEGGTGELYVLDAGGRVYKLRSTAPECSDGIDNDGDGLTDFPNDPGCPNAGAIFENPVCDDRFDNDEDGTMDLADSDCTTPYANFESAATQQTAQSMTKESLCGLGADLVLILPPLIFLRTRRRNRARWEA